MSPQYSASGVCSPVNSHHANLIEPCVLSLFLLFCKRLASRACVSSVEMEHQAKSPRSRIRGEDIGLDADRLLDAEQRWRGRWREPWRQGCRESCMLAGSEQSPQDAKTLSKTLRWRWTLNRTLDAGQYVGHWTPPDAV